METGLARALRVLIVVVLVGVVGFAGLVVAQQLSEEEARSLFEKLGCTSCHVEGGVAESWDDMLREIAEWAREYDSLDDAIRERVVYFGGKRFNSFDELMEQMRQNVGASEEDIRRLTEFYRAYFERSRQAQEPAAAETTATGQQAGSVTSVAGETGRLEPSGYEPVLVVGAAAAIVAVFIVAALVLGRRGGSK